MSLSNLTIKVQDGGLGVLPAGEDYISGMLFYNATLPNSGWTTKYYGSVEDAAVDGITSTSTGDTSNSYYQLKEYFRMNPNGLVWVNFVTGSTSSASTFSEIQDLQIAASGKIRQIAVILNSGTYVSSHLSNIKSVLTTLASLMVPTEILYSPNVASFDISSATDLASFNEKGITFVIGSDYSVYGLGKSLSTTLGYTASMVGTELGVVSSAKVSQSPAWVGGFNISDGTEYVNVKIGSSAYEAVTKAQMDQLDTYRYVFVRKLANRTGSWISGDANANDSLSDYNSIQRSRVINKVLRGVYLDLSDYLNDEVAIDRTTGYLDRVTVSILENAAKSNLIQMQKANEISGYVVSINPEQNILQTNNLDVVVKILPNGTLKYITIVIGFTPKV
jgi:hypothetical protein